MNRFLTILLLLPTVIKAQQTLSLQHAIDSALKNNLDIIIANDNVEQNKINNTFGMAGGLASVTVSAGDNNQWSTIHQEYNTGTTLDKSNVYGNNFNSAISAGYSLFNGFKVLTTKKQLEALQTQSELLLNAQVQNTMAAIMVKYYDIVRQQNYLSILKRSFDVANEKLNIISTRRSVGMANDADYLQAQIDVSAIDQAINSQNLVISQTKTDLQQLMNSKSFYNFSVTDSIVIDKNIAIDSITNCLKQNPQYLSMGEQIKINEALVKQINSQRYPSLKINTSYNFSYANNGAGSVLINQSYGPQAAITLQIPIYNGSIFSNQKKAAQCKVAMAEHQQQNLLTQYTSGAYKTFLSYQNTLQQLDAQQINYERSGKLVQIIMQRFKSNLATILDVKAAQLSYENAGYLLVNLQYAAKSAEIELKRLIYRLK